MNCDSKVNKFFANSGDMNGNFKLRQGDLATLSGRKLSQSDPMLLNSVEGIITANRVTGYYQVMMIMMMMMKIVTGYILPVAAAKSEQNQCQPLGAAERGPGSEEADHLAQAARPRRGGGGGAGARGDRGEGGAEWGRGEAVREGQHPSD